MRDESASTGINWKRLVAEGIAIVFSVLVALAFDEWRESRQDARRVERAKAEVSAEVRANRPRVERAMAYHDSLIKAIERGGNLTQVAFIPRAQLPRDRGNARELLDAIHASLEAHGASFESRGTLRRVNDSTWFLRIGSDRGQARWRPDGIALLLEQGMQLRTAFIRNVAWETTQATQATLHMDFELVSQLSQLYQLQRNYLEAVQTTVELLFSQRLETGALYDLLAFEKSLLRSYDRLEKLLGNTRTITPSSRDST